VSRKLSKKRLGELLKNIVLGISFIFILRGVFFFISYILEPKVPSDCFLKKQSIPVEIAIEQCSPEYKPQMAKESFLYGVGILTLLFATTHIYRYLFPVVKNKKPI